MTITLSIIVPVYNVEKYLAKCLESIIHQTFRDFELILVNDGSTDNSKTICEEYARRDKRIRVINQENEGVSSARNRGLDNAQGEYIGFVDSDDWIELDMYENLLNQFKINNNLDIVICNEKRVIKESVLECNDTGQVSIFNQEEAMGLLLDGELFQEYLWNKLYKKELFSTIRFPKGMLYEDTFVMYQLFLKSNQIAHIDMAKYYYVQRGGSILNGDFNLRKLDLLKACKQRHNEVSEKFPSLKKKSSLALLRAHEDIINQIILKNNTYQFHQLLFDVRSDLKEILKSDIDWKDLNSRKKVTLSFMLFNLKLYSYLLVLKANYNHIRSKGR